MIHYCVICDRIWGDKSIDFMGDWGYYTPLSKIDLKLCPTCEVKI